MKTDRNKKQRTRQVKSSQVKTRQDKTRQDKTRQDKTRQDKTRLLAKDMGRVALKPNIISTTCSPSARKTSALQISFKQILADTVLTSKHTLEPTFLGG